MEIFKAVLVGTLVVGLFGCAPRPDNMTPVQEARYQEAEDQRVQEMLSETSPRNMSPQPKAVPEFSTTIPGIRPRSD